MDWLRFTNLVNTPQGQSKGNTGVKTRSLGDLAGRKSRYQFSSQTV